MDRTGYVITALIVLAAIAGRLVKIWKRGNEKHKAKQDGD